MGKKGIVALVRGCKANRTRYGEGLPASFRAERSDLNGGIVATNNGTS